MTKVAPLVAVFLFFLVGCSKEPEGPVATAAPSAPVASPTSKNTATPEDWKKALESTYTISGIKNKSDGVTTFLACFNKDDGKCFAPMFAHRDAFRKRRFFKGMVTNVGWPNSFVGSYLSIGDNEKPILLLAPQFFGENGWLFMEKISFLLDGEPLFEREFEGLNVNRESNKWGVEERIDFVASDAELAALRKIKADSNLLIRLTGKKGYANLPKDAVKLVKGEVETLVLVYDKMSAALEGKIPPAVPAE